MGPRPFSIFTHNWSDSLTKSWSRTSVNRPRAALIASTTTPADGLKVTVTGKFSRPTSNQTKSARSRNRFMSRSAAGEEANANDRITGRQTAVGPEPGAALIAFEDFQAAANGHALPESSGFPNDSTSRSPRGLACGMQCQSVASTERAEVTARGYRRFRCRDCGRRFNERSGGVLNRASLPSDIIAFVVFCRLRYRLTLRDLGEIMALRGIEVSHEAVRGWEAKMLPVMGNELRKRRHGTRRGAGISWYVDETYLKVRGRWCYHYRAIDRDGNRANAITPVFVAMDPARDTADVLTRYLALFSPRLRGSTGSASSITEAERMFRVYAVKQPIPGGGGAYLMNHSPFFYLVGADGQVAVALSPDLQSRGLAEAIERHVRG